MPTISLKLMNNGKSRDILRVNVVRYEPTEKCRGICRDFRGLDHSNVARSNRSH